MLVDFRSQIIFNLESIQEVVHWMAFCAIRNSDGNLYVRCLNWNGDRWNWNYNWLDNDFNVDNPAALLATFFISPLADLLGSFVLRLFFLTNPQAFFQVQFLFQQGQCIFCHRVFLFPKEVRKVFLVNLFF